MALPSWFTLTPERVANDSRLQFHMLQQGDGYDATSMLADITNQLSDQLDVVVTRIEEKCEPLGWPFSTEQWTAAYPDESSAKRAERDRKQKSLAQSAVLELVIAALWKHKPGEDAAKIAQAALDGRGEAIIGGARIGSAESILSTLETRVSSVAARILNAANTPRRRRGAILMGRGDIAGAE